MSKSIITRAAAILLSFCLVIGGTDITVFAEGGNGGLTDGNTATATDAGGIQANDAADEAKEKESVYEGDGFRVTCQLQDSWDGGYTAGVRIENTGTDVIESWALGFDCPGGISDVWNAELETSDPENPGKYVVRNAGWNQDIAAGQSVEFGINGEGDFAGFPSEYHLLGKISSVTTEDYRVEYECKTDWETGFSAEITVTNLTDEELSDWVLEFDYESSLYDIWDAVVESHENNHYVIRNHDYNSGIPANGSVSFGFNAEAGKGEDAPENYSLYSYREEEGGAADTDPELDTDNDGLPDCIEQRFETDIRKTDTDDDGLSDYVELYTLALDPLSEDTDGNGLSDAEEDLDGDGLSNLTEYQIGTKIYSADTDEDGLTDAEETQQYGTDPFQPDTDGDEVSDGKETEIGSDPLVFEERFYVTAAADGEDTVNVSVDVELSGEQVESLSVRRFDSQFLFPEEMPGYIGGAYEFTADGEFGTATLHFEFDGSLLNDPSFDPVIYYFNEETQLLEPLDTTVSGNVASAATDHFSTYILLNRKKFEDSFKWQDVWTASDHSGADVALIIDDSGSMSDNDGSRARLSVARNLIDHLPENSRVGVVRFGGSPVKLTDTLTSDKEKAKSYLTSSYFHAYDGTYMYAAIDKAFSYFSDADDDTLKIMIVLSDGETVDVSRHAAVIDNAKSKGIKIYTVGLGKGSSRYFNDYMKPLAEETGGAFYLASEADELAAIYEDINDKIDITTDSDRDGVPDYYEDHMVMFNGMSLKMDKNDPDSDNDGLPDGEEALDLNYRYNADKTKVIVTGRFLSDPSVTDTDGDGVTDQDEIGSYGTSPVKADTDGDGLDDYLEITNWFDPFEADADSDGRLDSQEYSEGTSPFEYDKSWEEYRHDFIKGFIKGDFIAEPDNLAVVMGQIASCFIPFSDARDVVGNIKNGDYIMAGISALGLIPLAGDATEAVAKAGKFAFGNMDHLPKIVELGEFLEKNFPDAMRLLGKNDDFIHAVNNITDEDTIRLTRTEAKRITKMFTEAGVPEDTTRVIVKIFEAPNSKILAKNMIASGIVKPDYPCAAHHIVAGSRQGAKRARAIFRKFDIGINDAVNGVFLPTVRDVSEAAYHPSLHTNSYYDKVNKLLLEAGSKQEAIDILRDIAKALSEGTF